jgi:hypothetical protein
VTLRPPSVDIELSSGLLEPLPATVQDDVAEVAGMALEAMIGRLGIPAAPALTVRPVPSARAIRMRVEGATRAYPLSLFRRAWLATAPAEQRDIPLNAPALSGDAYPDRWLFDFAAGGGGEVASVVSSFVARVVEETLALHPECLVAEADVAPSADSDEVVTAEIVSGLLDLGVAVPPVDQLSSLLRAAIAGGCSSAMAAEEAFVRLAHRAVDVRLNPEYLAELGALVGDGPVAIDDESLPHDLSAAGSVVHRRLLELGIARPIHLASDDSLRFDELQIRVNDHLGLPLPLPQPNETVLHASPWSVKERGLEGRALVDAASGHRLTAVGEQPHELEGFGVTATPAVAFVAVAVAREVAPLAYRLLDVDDVEHHLAELEEGFPALVGVAVQRI